MCKQKLKCFTIFIIIFIFSKVVFSQVEVYTKAINLPTYGWVKDINPRLRFNLPIKTMDIECYPYDAHDALTGVKKDKYYDAIFLENEYIRLIILPEVGGRIQAATDKVNGWNFLQYNHVIKPTLTSTLIGAWESGGLEWNFPGGHRASGLDQVNYRIVENADGSKTVYLGEIEPSYRMKWVVGVTVFPGRSYFKIDAKFINATPFKHQIGSWFNAAVYATPETQVIFPPTAWSATHGIAKIWDWEGDIGNHAIYAISYIKRGKMYLQQKKYQKALKDFQKALEWPLFLGVGRYPEISNNMINYYIGLCYDGMSKAEKAREYWTKAVEQKLQEVSIAFYYRGLAAEKLGRKIEAKKFFELLTETADEHIKKKRDLPVAYILKSAGLKAFGEEKEAEVFRNKAIELDKLAELRAIGQSWGRIQMVSPPPMF